MAIRRRLHSPCCRRGWPNSFIDQPRQNQRQNGACWWLMRPRRVGARTPWRGSQAISCVVTSIRTSCSISRCPGTRHGVHLRCRRKKSNGSLIPLPAENCGGAVVSNNIAKLAASQRKTLPSPSDPLAVAREFVQQCCLHDGDALTLRHWRGGWWRWRLSHWGEFESRAVRSMLYNFTEHAIYLSAKGLAPWSPTSRKISDLMDALAAITILADDFDQPSWIVCRDSGTIVAVGNGLLDVASRQLHAHTPLYFNQTAVPFDYDPRASDPAQWLAFLDALWPHEPEAIDLLGEWFGYVVSGRLDLHKILLMVGPTRGGKGVIARVLTALLDRHNVAGPTLNSLGGDFGLAPLIGKPLAIISDARF